VAEHREPGNSDGAEYFTRMLEAQASRSYVEERARVFRLAPTNAEEALPIARGISVPWYRAQGLAAVLRWIDGHRVEAIAREAIAAALEEADDYKRSAAMAWPIAALVERDSREVAIELLDEARRVARRATPNSSRAYSLGLLLRASWPLGADVRVSLIEELADLQRQDSFWRVSRVLVDSLQMLGSFDEEFARGIVDRMVDDRWQRKAHSALDARGACAPGKFFEDDRPNGPSS
jgi:hypothetical protein